MRRPDPATWRKEVHHTSPWLDARTPRDWRCPGCSRSKFETVRWCERSPSGDFPAGVRLLLARHHDHAASEVEIIDGRFPVTIVCLDCNNVDGKVKATFPDLRKARWLFSVADIRRVIQVRHHMEHRIDYRRARAVALRVLFEDYRLLVHAPTPSA